MLLAAAMTVTMLVPGAQAAFSDTSGHWAESAITKWSEKYGIIQGYEDGTFGPDKPITRGAMAGIIDRVMHYQTKSPANTFSDTAGTIWEEPILKLNAAGVMLGDQGKALLWNDITRQEAVVMMARAFGVPESSSELTYSDADSVGLFARGYVAAMAERGYLTDVKDNAFRPREPITRAEFLNLLDQMVSVLYQTAGSYSSDVSGDLLINCPGVTLQNMTISGDLIIAPGATSAVTMEAVTVKGSIRNFSGIQPVTKEPEQPQTPTEPEQPEEPTDKPSGGNEGTGAIQPSQVYTPSATTGQYLTYDGKKIPIYRDAEPNTFTAGDFRWEDDRLVYTGSDFTTRFGIDVSAYQNRASTNNTIDWNAVKADGVDFVFVRAGFRGTAQSGTLNKDAFFEKNVDGAMAAGLETGVYFFAQAITVEEAIEEADYVISLLKGHTINGPVAYDWEMHDSTYRVYGTTPEMATACAIAFCKRIEEAGYKAMVYSGQYVSYIKYDMGALAPYLSWYPEYKSSSSSKLYPTLYYQMDYWQFSSSCSIDGIGGRVDANIQFIRK